MQTAPPPLRSPYPGPGVRATAADGSTAVSLSERTPGPRCHDGARGHARAPRAGALTQLHEALALLLMQTQDVLECGIQMLEAEHLDPDRHRDVLHLCARVDGVLWQIEDMMQVSKRLMNRTAHAVLDGERAVACTTVRQ